MDYCKKALIILYEDGYIDSIDIDEDINHIYYFRKLYFKSERVREILTPEDLNKDNHLVDYDYKFIRQNAVLFFNLNNPEVYNNPDFLENNVPDFRVFLPYKLGSIKQAEILEDFLRKHPTINTYFFKYDEDLVLDEGVSKDAWNLINDTYKMENRKLI